MEVAILSSSASRSDVDHGPRNRTIQRLDKLHRGAGPCDEAPAGYSESAVRLRAANSRLRSGVYFHHGFFGAPAMNRTAAMNVSSKQGSWRWPVMRHSSSYIAYGSRPGNSAGVVIPNW